MLILRRKEIGATCNSPSLSLSLSLSLSCLISFMVLWYMLNPLVIRRAYIDVYACLSLIPDPRPSVFLLSDLPESMCSRCRKKRVNYDRREICADFMFYYWVVRVIERISTKDQKK